MVIRSSDPNGQWCSSLVYPQVSFRAGFGSIRGIWTGSFASQRRWHHLAVHGLPSPLNMAFLMIILHHHSIDLLPQTGFVPGLKPLVQAAAGTIPFLLHTFPLTATSQHKQDPVHHLSIGQCGSSNTPSPLLSRQNSLDPFPQSIRNLPQRGITHSTLLAVCLVRTYNSALGVSFC